MNQTTVTTVAPAEPEPGARQTTIVTTREEWQDTLARKLASRKLWVAIATVLSMLAAHEYAAAAGVASAYILAEGVVDVVGAATSQ